MKAKLLILIVFLLLVSAVFFIIVGENTSYSRNEIISTPTSPQEEGQTANILDKSKSKDLLAEEEIIPTISHIKTPEQVRSIYMTSWTASSKSLRDGLVKFIDESRINSITIDIKDYSGVISFDINHSLIDEYETDSNRIPDIVDFIHELHEKNIYIIGRVTIFQDPLLAKKKPEFAVKRKSNGGVWKDRKGLAFLDPGKSEVWEYVKVIAEESYNLGFDEINFDYIRYPSDGNIADINYNLSDGESRVDVMRRGYKYLNEKLVQEKNIPISADLFGMTTTNTDDLGIGQNLEDALTYFDFVAPMVYPSHYPKTFHGYANPAANPYEIIKISMSKGVERANTLGVSVKKLRPWIQDFDMGATYDKAKVQAQIRATYEVGLDSYFVWDPRNKYTKTAFYDDLLSAHYKEYVPPIVVEEKLETSEVLE